MVEFTYVIKHKVPHDTFEVGDMPPNIAMQAYNAYTLQSIFDAMIEYVEIDQQSFNIKPRNFKVVKSPDRE
jgi:hypothetical protein